MEERGQPVVLGVLLFQLLAGHHNLREERLRQKSGSLNLKYLQIELFTLQPLGDFLQISLF